MLAIFIPLILAFFVPIMPGSESAPAARSPPGPGTESRAERRRGRYPGGRRVQLEACRLSCPITARPGPASHSAVGEPRLSPWHARDSESPGRQHTEPESRSRSELLGPGKKEKSF
jgi:hypothetical protein